MLCLTASHKVSFFHCLAKGSASALITWLLKTTVSKNAAELDSRQIVLDLGTHWLSGHPTLPPPAVVHMGLFNQEHFLAIYLLRRDLRH